MRFMLSALAIALLAVAPASAADPSAILEQAARENQARKLDAVAKIILLEGDQKDKFDSLYAEFQDALGAVSEKYANLGNSYPFSSEPLHGRCAEMEMDSRVGSELAT